MLRREIVDGVNQILQALDESEIQTTLDEIRKQRRAEKVPLQSSGVILASLKEYALRAERFNPAAKEISAILGLTKLQDPEVWAHLTIMEESGAFSLVYWDTKFAREHLPKIIDLLKQDKVPEMTLGSSETRRGDGLRKLTVLVFEPPKTLSSPARLADVLESIDHFYTAQAWLEKESPSTLSVVACDSGSDKSFDFLGIAKVIDGVERIIFGIWDRVLFYREHQFEERLDLISKSLPIIQDIARMEERKELDPELAEILRRNIFDGTNKFVQSGAIIPAIEDRAAYDPKRLLSPVQKLLVGSTFEDGDTTSFQAPEPNEPSTQSNELTDEETRILKKLLDRTNTKTETEQDNIDH